MGQLDSGNFAPPPTVRAASTLAAISSAGRPSDVLPPLLYTVT
jgi:hypothetical protein